MRRVMTTPGGLGDAAPMAPEGGGDGGGADLSRPVDSKSRFRIGPPSEAFLAALRPDGRPPRTTWDAQAATNNASSLFRLKVATLPELKDEKRKRTEYSKSDLFEEAARELSLRPGAFEMSAPSSPPRSPKKPKKRADKYYKLLMNAYDQRTDLWQDQEEDEAREKAEGAAKWAKRRQILIEERQKKRAAKAAKAAKKAAAGDSSSSESEDEEEEEEEIADLDALGKLIPWDGTMQVDLEIVVLNPPGVKDPTESTEVSSCEPSEAGSRASTRGSKDGASRKGSRSSDGSSSNKSGSPRGDLYEEFEALKEELGVDDEEKSEDSDDVPEGLRMKGGKNIWDNPKPRWSLGLGGTVFFIPDAERYSFGGSMPPPPPASLHGRHRLRLKPRLPLDISNNRYRDEHPNIWPDPPYEPELADYARFEQKLLTLDFYRGCNKALTRLPPAQTRKADSRDRTKFGRMVLDETRRSQAWKNFNHREMLRRKEERQKALEEAEARAKAEELARLAALASQAGVV